MMNGRMRQGVRNVERGVVFAVVLTRRARYTAMRPARNGDARREPVPFTATPQVTNNYKYLILKDIL